MTSNSPTPSAPQRHRSGADHTSSGKDDRPRFFDHMTKKLCWSKAEIVPGRHPERWRKDAAGNVVCKRFCNCQGCLCFEYDHIIPFSKGGESVVKNCQILQTRVNRYKSDKDQIEKTLLRGYSCDINFSDKELDIIEMAVYGDVIRPGNQCRCRSVAELLGKLKTKDDTAALIDYCCFSTDVLEEDAYKTYMSNIVAHLQGYYPDSSYMDLNVKKGGDKKTQIYDILDEYDDMELWDHPWQVADSVCDIARVVKGSLWEELQRGANAQSSSSEFDVSELENLFSEVVPKKTNPKDADKKKASSSKPEKIQLIDQERAINTEIMLTNVKIPLHDITDAILAMDDTLLDIDQVENILKFCPTNEEMDRLKYYTDYIETLRKCQQNFTFGIETLGKCEQYFLELMKVPRVKTKVDCFSFKIQFNNKLAEFKNSLNIVNSACDEVQKSTKLKEIMKKILQLGNILNQGTGRGPAVGFKLDSLLKLNDTRSSTTEITLMHYLCKVIAQKNPDLLDFNEDLVSLEAATKIRFKILAEEMQALIIGVKKVKQEFYDCAYDGPISEGFHQALKEFIGHADAEVNSVINLYSAVGWNADALAIYFGEDPAHCSFEKATLTLLNFVRLFRKADEENRIMAEA